MSGKFYGIKLTGDTESDFEEIETFVNEGTPVILVNELDELDALSIDSSQVIMVGRE
jgi:hypothetical protein